MTIISEEQASSPAEPVMESADVGKTNEKPRSSVKLRSSQMSSNASATLQVTEEAQGVESVRLTASEEHGSAQVTFQPNDTFTEAVEPAGRTSSKKLDSVRTSSRVTGTSQAVNQSGVAKSISPTLSPKVSFITFCANTLMPYKRNLLLVPGFIIF